MFGTYYNIRFNIIQLAITIIIESKKNYYVISTFFIGVVAAGNLSAPVALWHRSRKRNQPPPKTETAAVNVAVLLVFASKAIRTLTSCVIISLIVTATIVYVSSSLLNTRHRYIRSYLYQNNFFLLNSTLITKCT